MASNPVGLQNFTGKFRAYREGISGSPSSKVTKKPRESLVCNPCRQSKLRCDRGQPCGHCARRYQGTACSYQQYAVPKSKPIRNSVAEDRLLHLEVLVKELMQTQSSSRASNTVMPTKPITPPAMSQDLTGDVDEISNETGYVGATHWSALLEDIHELKAALTDSAGSKVSEVPVHDSASARGDELIFGSSIGLSSLDIISRYLPSKVECDRYISLYFRGETYIVPFIHTYHFQRLYQDFWSNSWTPSPLWLSILFSIFYMASIIGKANDLDPSLSNSAIIGNISLHEAAGKCLVLGHYQRPQPFALEALAMYGHCKNLRSLDPSREAGAILGIVVRMGYEMGYHRDPDFLGIGVFDGEMRRRFWATVKQMDLMVSFQLGLPSNIRLENCDTRSPRNLLDEDFDSDTLILPDSRSENEATRLLWFIVKDRLMIGFGKVCNDALSFKEKSETEIRLVDQQIRDLHASIPKVLQTRPFSESIMDPPFLIMTRLYMEFIHLKSLCVLHRRYMAQGNSFSTEACVEAGKRIVSQFIDMYKELSSGGQLHSERWMLSNFTMNDFLLGVMVLCLFVHIRRKRGREFLTNASITETTIFPLLEESLVICVEKSHASRDARRVLKALRLTLRGVNGAAGVRQADEQYSLSTAVASAENELANNKLLAIGSEALATQPYADLEQGKEAAFGILDPFNFIGNDLGNIDWTAFDTQVLGEDDLQMNGVSLS